MTFANSGQIVGGGVSGAERDDFAPYVSKSGTSAA